MSNKHVRPYSYAVLSFLETLCPMELLNSTARPVAVNYSSGSVSSPFSLTTNGWNSGQTTLENQALEVLASFF